MTQHWSAKIAEKVVKQHPNLDMYVVASGITPSGSVHIGNYREFITNYFVACQLKRMGKNVRMIFSWDNYDRFRKVPKNVTVEGFEKYIGMPVTAVPDPWGEYKYYAERFQKEFEKALGDLKIDEVPLEYRYQSREYQSGRYNELMCHAVKNRHKIYDIITSFKTQGSDEGERAGYFPISVFCKHCNKDFTKVLGYDESKDELEYTCKCGATTRQSLLHANNVKLVWKVDWPMRWKVEGVVFEAAGPDHMTAGGSHDVAERIAREIFGIVPPVGQVYGFVGIKGMGVKMSSSKGNNITPGALLNIYEPDIINWLFSKYMPEDFFEFGFDDTIIRHYQEFDREMNNGAVNFGTLATVAPIVGFDEKLVRRLLKLDSKVDLSRVGRVKYWLENYCPEKIYTLRTTGNREFWATLSGEERATVMKLHDYLAEGERAESDIQQFLYSIINDPSAEKKQNVLKQQRYFKIFYNLLFGRDDGPRLYLYLASADRGKIVDLVGGFAR